MKTLITITLLALAISTSLLADKTHSNQLACWWCSCWAPETGAVKGQREMLTQVAIDLDKTLPIKTDSVKTYPGGTTQNRAWFVEMVE